MRIRDWSADVCSSDLLAAEAADPANVQIQLNLSALAISLGRADIAVTHLREEKLLDTTGSHASDAAMLTVEVDKMAENTPPRIHKSEERRVGKECVSPCRYRRSPNH